MTLLSHLAAQWRSVGSTRTGLAAHICFCIADEIERDPRAIGIRAVEAALFD